MEIPGYLCPKIFCASLQSRLHVTTLEPDLDPLWTTFLQRIEFGDEANAEDLQR